MKSRWRRLRPKVLAGISYFFARLLAKTLRWKAHGLENVDCVSGGIILCAWHGRTFLPANLMRNRGIWALFSLSNDGELQSRIFSLLGFKIIRGSTGRGGERALIEAIRLLRRGETLAITPDGPRGPAGVVQDGVLYMAKKSGAALVPMAASAKGRWLVRTWDKYMVPKPFAKAIVKFGEPIWFSSDATPSEMDQVREKLAEAMNRLEDEANRELRLRQ